MNSMGYGNRVPVPWEGPGALEVVTTNTHVCMGVQRWSPGKLQSCNC